MKDKRNILIIVLVVFLMGVGLPAVSSAVIVSTECGYSADLLVCEIYADTEGVSLISGGVTLNYNSTELTPVIYEVSPVPYAIQKNEDDWYFGDGTTNHAYMAPETATAGEVVYIVGKLDENSPSSGVSGSRVLIGKARFTHTNTLPLDPIATFGISLGLGRTTASYVNFVNTNGDPLDNSGVSFEPVEIWQLGDANGSGGIINSQDMASTRYFIVNGGVQHPWMDCNASGGINSQDMACIRYIIVN